MKLPLEFKHLSKCYTRGWPSRTGPCRDRSYATAPTVYDAVVIGAGPGGLTCVSNLLDQGLSRVCMVDPSFTAGRINEKYREVPSNTKAGMFMLWATGTNAFSRIIEATPKPHAFEKLQSFDPDKGCTLADAVDVAKLLSDGLRRDSRVDSVLGWVELISQDGNVWDLPKNGVKAERVVLAHGSHPRHHDLADGYPHLQAIDLDTGLKPSALRSVVPAGSKVGVIGASHSAILALKNLFELEDVSIVNFHRSPLLYAVYKDGWILYDNTGLKGVAAEWAREVLEAKDLPPRLRRVDLKSGERSEKDIYAAELKDCTHLISAIGYETNPVPKVEVDGDKVQPAFDPLTGKFFRAKADEEYVNGLFGAGIAYPERVTDRAGNVESAVGWLKFMTFLKRVSPDWVERT